MSLGSLDQLLKMGNFEVACEWQIEKSLKQTCHWGKMKSYVKRRMGGLKC